MIVSRGRGPIRLPASKRAISRALLTVILSMGGAMGAAQSQPQLIERGRSIAERLCARCHAITATGQSPSTAAPPFRDLSKRYPIEQLAEALAEGIVVGHSAMPEFRFEPAEIDDLLAYLESLAPASR